MTSVDKSKKEREKGGGKGEERNRKGERKQKINVFRESRLIFLINRVLIIHEPKAIS